MLLCLNTLNNPTLEPSFSLAIATNPVATFVPDKFSRRTTMAIEKELLNLRNRTEIINGISHRMYSAVKTMVITPLAPEYTAVCQELVKKTRLLGSAVCGLYCRTCRGSHHVSICPRHNSKQVGSAHSRSQGSVILLLKP